MPNKKTILVVTLVTSIVLSAVFVSALPRIDLKPSLPKAVGIDSK